MKQKEKTELEENVKLKDIYRRQTLNVVYVKSLYIEYAHD